MAAIKGNDFGSEFRLLVGITHLADRHARQTNTSLLYDPPTTNAVQFVSVAEWAHK